MAKEKVTVTYVSYAPDGTWLGTRQKKVDAEKYYEDAPMAKTHKEKNSGK